MLHINRSDDLVDPDAATLGYHWPTEPMADAMAFIRRRFSIILLACATMLVIALLYLIAAVPTFTATAKLVVDAKAAPGDTASVSTSVESQIAIIKSEGLARAVIRKLDLTNDPEFVHHGVVRGMVRSLSRQLGWSKPGTEAGDMRYALEAFERKLLAKRVGLTYIIEITFDSTSPERAVQILNTVVETNTAAQLDAKYRSALGDEKWVKDRISELSNQAVAAQQALATYRNNGIESAGAADGVGTGTHPSQSTAKVQGELRELEVAAESAARTYDNFLRGLRYMEAQQQSFSTEAHLLTEVSRPLEASWPKAGIVLGISTVGGMLVGIAIGMLLDLSDRRTAPASRFGQGAFREGAAVPGIMASASKAPSYGAPKSEKHRAHKEPDLDH